MPGTPARGATTRTVRASASGGPIRYGPATGRRAFTSPNDAGPVRRRNSLWPLFSGPVTRSDDCGGKEAAYQRAIEERRAPRDVHPDEEQARIGWTARGGTAGRRRSRALVHALRRRRLADRDRQHRWVRRDSAGRPAGVDGGVRPLP